MNRRSCWLALLALTICLSACTNIRPLTASRTLDGQVAKDLVLVVLEPIVFRYGFGTHTLPAGRYTPAFEDDEGMYFQAPNKLIISGIGSTLHDGGIFFKAGHSGEPYEWIILGNGGAPQTFRLPQTPHFRIEKR